MPFFQYFSIERSLIKKILGDMAIYAPPLPVSTALVIKDEQSVAFHSSKLENSCCCMRISLGGWSLRASPIVKIFV